MSVHVLTPSRTREGLSGMSRCNSEIHESYVHEVYLKLKLTLHSPLVIHFVVATNSPTVRAGCALQVLCLD